jgi:anti-sigma factor RsiW
MSPFRRRKRVDDVDCQDFVELITDYLEGVIPAETRARIDQHLTICPGCATALEQWKTVIEVTGHLADAEVDTLDPDTRAQLLAAFRRGAME